MKKMEFESPEEWWDFCSYLSHKNRYILNKRWKRFIDTILFTAKRREDVLEKGSVLVRARKGCREEIREYEKDRLEVDIKPLAADDLKAPPRNKADEGRINPKGISYLYLASNLETAITEVRPHLRQNASVGYFEITKDVKIIDTSRDKQTFFIYPDDKKIKVPPEKKEACIWGWINFSFSLPIAPGEEHRNYVPTQYISECFKNNGYDGIVYKSSLVEKGVNVVLFNPNFARLRSARVFKIATLKYEFEENSNPVFFEE